MRKQAWKEGQTPLREEARAPWEEGPAPAEGRVSGARIWVRWVRGPDAEAGPAAKAAG